MYVLHSGRLRGDLSKATELRDKYQSEYREVEDLEGKVKKLQQVCCAFNVL